MTRTVALALILLLSACGPQGPTREDMRGCLAHSQITARDVAECAIEREGRNIP
jgi:hypothetical protein